MTDIQHHTLPELWRQSSDNANEPYILQTGSLYWTGSAWAKATQDIFGGGSQYEEDTAHTDGDKGNFMLAVRNDGGDVRSGTDGDYEALPVSSYGSLAGVAVHVVGEGDKYIKTNIDVGAAVGNDDGIPIAGVDSSGNKLNLRSGDTGTFLVQQEDRGEAYKIDDANGDGSTIYEGWAAVGSSGGSSVWRLRRQTTTGNVTEIEWQDGDTDYDNEWDERAVDNYS